MSPFRIQSLCRRRLRTRTAPVISGLAIAFALLFVSPSQASEESSVLVSEYLAAAAGQLAIPARGALRRMNDTPRQLLATRAYLRAASTLADRWSWSEERIQSFAAANEHRELLAEIRRVRAAFEAQNPGYSLFANTQARSLNLQIVRWNENASVGRVARHLHRAAMTELRAGSYPSVPTAGAVDRFADFLRTWRPPIAAPLAAPGLSMHGQCRAIDFQIVKAGQIIAGTQIASVRSVWEGQGWGRKLRLAIGDARFAGPLQSPNEPWHYEYVGGAQLAANRPQATGDSQSAGASSSQAAASRL